MLPPRLQKSGNHSARAGVVLALTAALCIPVVAERAAASTGSLNALARTAESTVTRVQPTSAATMSSQGFLGTGDYFSCALATGGSLKCWGWEDLGKLGNGSTASQQTSPVSVLGVGESSGGAAITNLTSIAVGEAHSCALDDQSGVVCWGYNNSGQLGNNTTTTSAVPVRVKSGAATDLTGARQVGTGSGTSCAVLNTGALHCWGSVSKPDGTVQSTSTAIEVVSSGVASVAVGSAHICTLSTSGAVSCWGFNDKGQLGHGTVTATRLAQGVPTGMGAGVTMISARSKMTCALMNDATVNCWGENQFGQLGRNTTSTDEVAPSPVLVDASTGLGAITAISAGGSHACALTTTGTVKCWGWGLHGQLGRGSQSNSLLAVDVHTSAADSSPVTGVAAVKAGISHTCVLLSNGSVKCAGRNSFGELGDGSTTTRTTLVGVTGSFAVPDTTSPGVAISRAGAGGLRSGESESVTFTLTEAASVSTAFTADDVVVTGGTLSAFSGSGLAYTATVTPTPGTAGTLTIDVGSGAFSDAAGNPNTAASQLSIAFDAEAPTAVVARAGSGSLADGDTDTLTFTLSEVSTDFSATDITVTGGTLSGFAGSGVVYTATFTPTPDTTATASVSVAAGTFTDAAGNPNLASAALTFGVDTTTTTTTTTSTTSTTTTTTTPSASTTSVASPPAAAPAAPVVTLIEMPSTGVALAKRSDGVEVRSEVTVESSDTVSTITIRNEDGSEITVVHEPTLIRTNFTVYRGTSLTISGDGYLPGTDIDVWLNSSPTYLGTTMTTPNGTFTFEVVIPGDFELGDHVLQVEGSVLADVEQATFIGLLVLDRTMPELPATGREASTSLPALLLAIGLMLTIGVSRRRPDTSHN